MKIWTFERARSGFSEIVRRALKLHSQVVVPESLVDFLRSSPLAEAVAAGDFADIDGDLFPRSRDY